MCQGLGRLRDHGFVQIVFCGLFHLFKGLGGSRQFLFNLLEFIFEHIQFVAFLDIGLYEFLTVTLLFRDFPGDIPEFFLEGVKTAFGLAERLSDGMGPGRQPVHCLAGVIDLGRICEVPQFVFQAKHFCFQVAELLAPGVGAVPRLIDRSWECFFFGIEGGRGLFGAVNLVFHRADGGVLVLDQVRDLLAAVFHAFNGAPGLFDVLFRLGEHFLYAFRFVKVFANLAQFILNTFFCLFDLLKGLVRLLTQF